MRREALFSIPLLLLPAFASAQQASTVLPQLVGFANIFAGLMLVAAILLFGGGFIDYITHLGLDERDEGLDYMKGGISVAFTLVLILFVVQYVQQHVTVIIYLFGIAVTGIILWLLADAFGKKEEKKPEKK